VSATFSVDQYNIDRINEEFGKIRETKNINISIIEEEIDE